MQAAATAPTLQPVAPGGRPGSVTSPPAPAPEALSGYTCNSNIPTDHAAQPIGTCTCAQPLSQSGKQQCGDLLPRFCARHAPVNDLYVLHPRRLFHQVPELAAQLRRASRQVQDDGVLAAGGGVGQQRQAAVGGGPGRGAAAGQVVRVIDAHENSTATERQLTAAPGVAAQVVKRQRKDGRMLSSSV